MSCTLIRKNPHRSASQNIGYAVTTEAPEQCVSYFFRLPSSARSSHQKPLDLALNSSFPIFLHVRLTRIILVFSASRLLKRAASGGELGVQGVVAVVALAISTIWWLIADAPEEPMTKVYFGFLLYNGRF